MHRRGRIYWLTWALLVLGAAATGIASVQDAFFRGAIAAFLAPLALPLYERAGPRGAAFLGVLTGIAWQLGLTYGYGALAWNDTLRAYAASRLEIDLSIAAAAFAGAALAGALVHRTQRFAQAATLGAVLALAMTALPYGFIRSSETARLGPVEVTWLAPASAVEENGRPWRPKGTKPPVLGVDDITSLRQAFLTVVIEGETAIVDTQGRRLWAVWRKRLTQTGHEDGPVRKVFIASTRSTDDKPSLVLALPDDPGEACALELNDDGFKVVAGRALVADAATLFQFKYENAFDRFIDAYLWRGKNQPAGLHAPAFLRLATCADSDYERSEAPWQPGTIHNQIFGVPGHGQVPRSPILWVLRRTAMETPGEAEPKPVETSDRFFGFTLTMPDRPKPKQPENVSLTVPDTLPAPRELTHPRLACNLGADTKDTPLPELTAPATEPAPAAK
ncbi:MAG: hypothetical protein ACO23N_04865 [Opitutales bacterium]